MHLRTILLLRHLILFRCANRSDLLTGFSNNASTNRLQILLEYFQKYFLNIFRNAMISSWVATTLGNVWKFLNYLLQCKTVSACVIFFFIYININTTIITEVNLPRMHKHIENTWRINMAWLYYFNFISNLLISMY